MMWFVVTLPDSTTQEFELPDRAKGQDLLDEVSFVLLAFSPSIFFLIELCVHKNLSLFLFRLNVFFSDFRKVCKRLEIIEQDYFGLQYLGAKREKLWLNKRNKICRQLTGSQPHRLRFRTKFFVQPHLLVQDSTK